MELNTKLILCIQNMVKQINKKFVYFKVYFGTGIFFLFLGFLIGNLFGSFLTLFQELFIWQGLITPLIVLFIELINYLRYQNTMKIVNFNNSLISFVKKTILKTFNLINWNFIQYIFYKKIKFLNVFKRKQKAKPTREAHICFAQKKNSCFEKLCPFGQNFFVKSLNLFKIGILLGFFIDAFKVGS